jgi:hypothetical protein
VTALVMLMMVIDRQHPNRTMSALALFGVDAAAEALRPHHHCQCQCLIRARGGAAAVVSQPTKTESSRRSFPFPYPSSHSKEKRPCLVLTLLSKVVHSHRGRQPYERSLSLCVSRVRRSAMYVSREGMNGGRIRRATSEGGEESGTRCVRVCVGWDVIGLRR